MLKKKLLISCAAFTSIPTSANAKYMWPELNIIDEGTSSSKVDSRTPSVTPIPSASDQTVAPQKAQLTPIANAVEPATTDDIVVTATRRSERLSNVPIAVTAVSQAALQNSGATDIRQLSQLVPSLNVSSTGSEASASARIRGVGTVGDNPGLESSVAVFIDGVYRSRTGSGLNDLGEVERVEVLRGPQGTLFGRNASAGLINIVTKQPAYSYGGYGELTYGNFNNVRAAGAITGPIIPDKLAFRLDAVYGSRDGFLYDVVNRTNFNNRNRLFVRGQLLFEPTNDITLRLIGDYTYRNEKCCGAVYVDTREKTDPTPGVPGDYAISPTNRVVSILTSQGGVLPSNGNPYNRQIAQTAGRAYSNVTRDYGGSAQLDWKLGNTSLTSITAYREYRSYAGGDIDYSNVDIGYRPDDGNAYRQFHTFTQEMRLQGSAFGGRIDWLIGGYYSREELQVVDNLKFGTQYGAFAACRIVASVNATAALRNPAASGCLTPTGRGTLTAAFGAAGPLIVASIDRLSTLNDLGSTRDDYRQNSENFAFFTHNIVKLTSTLSITGGLRFTHERKELSAAFANNNIVCPSQQAALSPLLTNASIGNLATGILTLSCTGNSTSVLNGKTISDKLGESEFTGTAELSWKPTRGLLIYASYSRGYKAGGYNLDRSDLGPAALSSTTASPDASLLRFDPETVNAYEFGAKLSAKRFNLNFALFRSEFKNFQLNAFNGTNYIVQNIDSCNRSLNGADQDSSSITGSCASGTGYGLRSQGFEIEAGIRPANNVNFNIGYTYAQTKYNGNLVGSDTGEALDASLFLLSNSQASSAPRNVVSGSATFTPKLSSGGLTGLLYIDGRLSSDYNTGSDLFYEKAQDGFFLANARIGVRGPRELWAIELWVQNMFNTNYQQVAFAAPFQGTGSLGQTIRLGTSPSNQIFSAFLGDPRTFGVTVRSRF